MDHELKMDVEELHAMNAELTLLSDRANALVARGSLIASEILVIQGGTPAPRPESLAVSARRIEALHVQRNKPAGDLDGFKRLIAVIREIKDISEEMLAKAEKVGEKAGDCDARVKSALALLSD